MLTEKDYCDYDTCVALVELGYNGNRSNYCYLEKNKQQLESEAGMFLKVFRGEKYTYINAIHLYEAQKWLREEKNIIVNIYYYPKNDKYNEHWYWLSYQNGHQKNVSGNLSATYEEALLEGIKEAVKILKEDNNDTGR